MNSRAKGARGERQWRDELRANGYRARRGQQFCGSPDSPDVVCDDLPWAHFEVKAVEKLNLYDAIEQAIRDAGTKTPFLAHRRNHRPWLITMRAEVFFEFLRGTLPPEAERAGKLGTQEIRNGAVGETILGVPGETPDTAREARAVPGNHNTEQTQQTQQTET